ncbi:MAG: hypothetical protein RL766_1868 [Bacteroidota bacterium]
MAGGILAGVLILYSVILIVTDQLANQSLTWISYVFMIGLLIYFIREFGKANENNKTFGELFSFGFKASAFATIILLAFQVIFNLLFPETQERIMEISREKMAEDPRVTDEQIEMALSFTKKFYLVFLIAGTIFSTLIFGAIGSLIGAAVTKKNPTSPFQNQ